MKIKLKGKPYVPNESKFDRLDASLLYDLVEQALARAEVHAAAYRKEPPELRIAHLQYLDTALSDAQAGTRALLRKVALSQRI